MIPIKHLMHINASIEEVFSALSDIKKLSEWYTTSVKGKFENESIVLTGNEKTKMIDSIKNPVANNIIYYIIYSLSHSASLRS